MEKLTEVPGSQLPGDPDGPALGCLRESWRELAEHSADHDQLTGHPATKDPGAYARYVSWRRRELGLAHLTQVRS